MMEGHESERNLPGFDSHDECCKNVGQQGKRQVCHLRDVDDVCEVTMH